MLSPHADGDTALLSSAGVAAASHIKESLPLERLMELTDIGDIEQQLRILNEEEHRIDGELDALLRGQGEEDKKLESLESMMPVISAVAVDAAKLYDVVSRTSALAETISSKVRQLDLQQSRVVAVLSLVQDIQTLNECLEGVQRGMASNDYESSATHVMRFLQFDLDRIERIFIEAEKHGPLPKISAPALSADSHALDEVTMLSLESLAGEVDAMSNYRAMSPIGPLRSAQKVLIDQVTGEYDAAVQKKDEVAILRLAKLFPMLGYPAVGLDKFSAYLCGLVSRACQDGMRNLNTHAYSAFVTLLTNLFEIIAGLVDAQEDMIEKSYGPGRMLWIIQRLQREADIQTSIILDTFCESVDFERKLRDISTFDMSRGKTPAGKALELPVEPRQVDAISNELAAISQRTSIFQTFLKVRGSEQVQKLGGPDHTVQEMQGVEISRESALVRKVDELMIGFSTLEEYYIRRSIEMAMKIDQHEAGSLTTSSVDDAFYIVKKSISRSISSSSPVTIRSVLGIVAKVLEVDFIGIFQRKLSSTFVAAEAKETKIGFMCILNNIDVSCDYLQKLVKEVDTDINELASSMSADDVTAMRTSLRMLSEYASNFKKILMSLRPKIRPLLQDSYKDLKYVLTEEEYSEQATAETFVKRFIANLTKLIELYRKNFTDRNYNQTITHVVDALSKEWERILLQQKFNALGALRLDRDVRSVVSHVTMLSTWSLRDSMLRIIQMAVVLSVEKADEVAELWAGGKVGGVSWRLTAAEVLKVLALRSDIKADDIAKLKL